MSTATQQKSWFVLLKEDEDIEILTKMLLNAINLAKSEDRILKVRVQEINIEDSFP